jgi:hypothetical protein
VTGHSGLSRQLTDPQINAMQTFWVDGVGKGVELDFPVTAVRGGLLALHKSRTAEKTVSPFGRLLQSF